MKPLRIVIVMHARDRSLLGCNLANAYLISSFIPYWRAAGHEVILSYGVDGLPDADVAILHVDLSVIPDEYVQAVARYPIVVNGRALDIRKSRISRNLLRPGDAWPGPVIVKTDLNFGGMPERFRGVPAHEGHGRSRSVLGRTTDAPTYWIYPALANVPDSVFSNPELVVERFLPERQGKLYAVRTWVFFGNRGYCRRFVSHSAIIKGTEKDVYAYVDIPEQIQEERKRLEFDFGKFDFVVHGHESYLLDANRTPSSLSPTDSIGPTVHSAATYAMDGLASIVGSQS